MFTVEKSLTAQLASNMQHSKDNEEWPKDGSLWDTRINTFFPGQVAIMDNSLKSPWKVAFKQEI